VIRLSWEIVGALSQFISQNENPYVVDSYPRDPVPFHVPIGFLVEHVLKEKHEDSIYILNFYMIVEKYNIPVYKTDWIHPPRNILVDDQRHHDKKTCYVMHYH
jgi:hypothetical protein